MKIKYVEGPERVTMGEAGEFRRGVEKEVEDSLAEQILKKKTIIFQKVDEPKGKKKKEE